MTGSAMYRGHVTHQRLQPLRHRLRYRIFSLLLDLDELPALDARLKLLSVNRGNVLSFRERDHGDGSAPSLKAQVEGWLQAAGLPCGGRIRLLTMPRLLGYAFNPLSVYFCEAPHGALQAIVYEVNSTFGERHHYLLAVSGPQAQQARAGRAIAQRCAKRMHVSPFIGMEASYVFRIMPPQGDAPLHLGVNVVEQGAALLATAYAARPQALTDAGLLQSLLLHPLLTLKVIAAIHWEALLLFVRRVPLHPRPARTASTLTIVPSPP